MRIIEDFLCIVLLIVLPDWYLEKTGLYLWMFRIKERRMQTEEEAKHAAIEAWNRRAE